MLKVYGFGGGFVWAPSVAVAGRALGSALAPMAYQKEGAGPLICACCGQPEGGRHAQPLTEGCRWAGESRSVFEAMGIPIPR